MTTPLQKKAMLQKLYDHDRVVALSRLVSYKNIMSGNKVLDIGSGSGAFVDVCREINVETYGCEIAEYSCSKSDEFIYKNKLEDINFPVDYFDVVTCHDVIEHSSHPIAMLLDMFRITKQEGSCIMEIPRFFADEGKHHWKIEHLWYFSSEQFIALVNKIGFKIKEVRSPIPSKVVFVLQKPIQKRVKILYPPGMGDSLWSINQN